MMTKANRGVLVALCVLAVLPLAGCPEAVDITNRLKALRGPNASERLWNEKCTTVAGQKIYRKVEGVEGILLLKVRSAAGENEWHDRNFPGGAMALEATGDEYITSFLGYEHSGDPSRTKPVTAAQRGYINTDFLPNNPSNDPGYRYVDLVDEKDGTRYRYSGSVKAVDKKDPTAWKAELEKDPNLDLNIYRWTLDRTYAPDPAPRYAVTFEDHVVPEERALAIASSTLKVLDMQTGEVLAEHTMYALTGGFGVRSSTSPWLVARQCPTNSGDPHARTRQFVDQVLIPKKDR